MENKGAEAVMLKESKAGLRMMLPEEKEQAATKTFMESAMERLRQMKVEAPAVERYWASLKSKARTAGDYTTLMTHQGVSLFGEPNIGPIVDSC